MLNTNLAVEKAVGKSTRRNFLMFSASAAAGVALISLRKLGIVHAANGLSEVAIVEFSDSGEKLKRLQVATTNGASSYPLEFLPSLGAPIRKLHTPENIGSNMKRAFTDVFAARMQYSVRIQSSIRGQAGPVFGRPSLTRTSAN